MPAPQALDALIQKDPQLAFLRELILLARTLVNPSRVLLFGSRARGDARKTSDVDQGLSVASPLSKEIYDRIAQRYLGSMALTLQAIESYVRTDTQAAVVD